MNPAGPESALGIPWPFLPFLSLFQINTTKNLLVIAVLGFMIDLEITLIKARKVSMWCIQNQIEKSK
jgi:hypothetical protein